MEIEKSFICVPARPLQLGRPARPSARIRLRPQERRKPAPALARYADAVYGMTLSPCRLQKSDARPPAYRAVASTAIQRRLSPPLPLQAHRPWWAHQNSPPIVLPRYRPRQLDLLRSLRQSAPASTSQASTHRGSRYETRNAPCLPEMPHHDSRTQKHPIPPILPAQPPFRTRRYPKHRAVLCEGASCTRSLRLGIKPDRLTQPW